MDGWKYYYEGKEITPREYYNRITTSTSTNYTIPYTYIDHTSVTIAKDATFRCPYCDTLHESNKGVCDRCGAPLSMAVLEG